MSNGNGVLHIWIISLEKNSGSKSITLSNDQENKIIKKSLSEIHLSKEDTNYLKELESNALEAKTIIEKLDLFLEKKLGNESISFSKITLFIEEIVSFKKEVLRAKNIKNDEMKKDNPKVSRTSSNIDIQENTNKIESEKRGENTGLETKKINCCQITRKICGIRFMRALGSIRETKSDRTA